MKTKLVAMILVLGVLCFFTAVGYATPLPADMSGYYKFGYFDGNTYAAKAEMGIGAIKVHILADPSTLYLGIIVGDKIYFHGRDNQPSWGVLTQIDESTALITSHDADTGETKEFTVIKITEEEAQQITEENKRVANNDGCVNNLKLIGLYLNLYARDHDGEFPYSFDDLYPDYVKDKNIFVCPARGGEFRDYEMDYEYIPGFRQDSPNPDREVIVIESPGNHLGTTGDVYHVLYLDGHVERLTR